MARKSANAQQDKVGGTVEFPQGVQVGESKPAEANYPERPYAEALTDEHRAVLRDAGQGPVE